MTRDEARKAAAVMLAYSDGAEIELRYGDRPFAPALSEPVFD
jgi:hypothetical protein